VKHANLCHKTNGLDMPPGKHAAGELSTAGTGMSCACQQTTLENKSNEHHTQARAQTEAVKNGNGCSITAAGIADVVCM
jgi:hypothetical protein